MRTFLILTILVFITSSMIYASANTMNYQGLLTNASGDPVADASYSVVFTIYDAASGGNSKWAETTSVTTLNGLFSIQLGLINPVLDTVFNGSDRFLSIAVDGDPELTPRTEFSIVPYSLQSFNALQSANLAGESPDYYLAWSNITGIPSGFADGTDDQLSGADVLSIVTPEFAPIVHTHNIDSLVVDSTVKIQTFGHQHYLILSNPDYLVWLDGELASNVLGTTGRIQMPITLPDSVRVVEISVVVKDGDGDRDIVVYLFRVDTLMLSNYYGPVITSGANGIQNLILAGTPYTNNNQAYTYYVQVNWPSPLSGDPRTMSAGLVRVKYKVAKLP